MGVSYSTKMAEDWSLDMREELRSVLYSPDVEAAMQEVMGVVVKYSLTPGNPF